MLSAKSRRLYRRLLELGPTPRADAGAKGIDDEAVAELLDHGLVREIAERLNAVPPRAAHGRVAMLANARSGELLRDAVEAQEFLESCSRFGREAEPAEDSLVELVADYTEVKLLSSTLQRDAKREVLSIQTSHLPPLRRDGTSGVNVAGPVEADRAAGIRYRVVYARDLFDDPLRRREIEDFVAHGEDARMHPGPPLKLKVVDDAVALVPLDETGEAGALLVRSRQICTLLVDYFERIWGESVPVGEINRDDAMAVIKAIDMRVLAMLADDFDDAVIARRLNLSERSVRRHISSLCAILGVQTRTGIIAAAARKGWLP
jgi:DNA-binding CsgD family transcriptional regulator